MNIKLNELVVHCKQSAERVPFTDFTYFYGQMGAGKSTIARLIDYCLGGDLELTPALQSEFVAATLNLWVAGNDVTLTRNRESDQISAQWEKPGVFIPFSVTDLKELPSLAIKLKDPADAVSTYLKSQLSVETLAALASNPPPHPQLQMTLVADFNKIVGGPSIYDSRRFAGVACRSETQRLVLQKPHGEVFLRLNRLLLEDAYPVEISRSQPGESFSAIIPARGEALRLSITQA